MRFFLILEKTTPEETIRLLRQACDARSIEFVAILPRAFGHSQLTPQPGDLLYRAAVTTASQRVEQRLFQPGVSTFYRDPDGPFFEPHTPPLLFTRHGVPIPPTLSVSTSAPEVLSPEVDRLGGFPLIVKILGRSSGIGVMRLESLPALVSILDYSLAQGHAPLLCQEIRNAIHWRVIVLHGTVIAGYRNLPIAGDFRTSGSTDPADYRLPIPSPVAAAAIQATAACRLHFAGVDVLEDPAGRPWVLEANFPCYFAQAQLHSTTDVAGLMLDFLVQNIG